MNEAVKVRQQTQSHLLSLPAELRVLIYEYVFSIKSEAWMKWRRRRKLPSVLALLQTCRQVLAEAETIFYEINCISYEMRECRNTPVSFLRSLHRERLESVTALSLWVLSAEETLAGLKELHLAPNLTYLKIRRGLLHRWMSPSSWRDLVPEMQDRLSELKRLKGLVVETPNPTGAKAPEDRQLHEMQMIDRMLYDAATGRHTP